jgi:hypothetical protein
MCCCPGPLIPRLPPIGPMDIMFDGVLSITGLGGFSGAGWSKRDNTLLGSLLMDRLCCTDCCDCWYGSGWCGVRGAACCGIRRSSIKFGTCNGACEGKAGTLEEGDATKDARPLLLGSTSSVNKSNSTEWACVTEGRGASETSSTSSRSNASTGADVANDERRLNGLGGFAG